MKRIIRKLAIFLDDHLDHAGIVLLAFFVIPLILTISLDVAISKSVLFVGSIPLRSAAQGVYENGYLDTKYDNNEHIKFEQDGKKIIISHDFWGKVIATPKSNKLVYTHECNNPLLYMSSIILGILLLSTIIALLLYIPKLELDKIDESYKLQNA